MARRREEQLESRFASARFPELMFDGLFEIIESAVRGHGQNRRSSYVFLGLYAFDGHRSITYIDRSPSYTPYRR